MMDFVEEIKINKRESADEIMEKGFAVDDVVDFMKTVKEKYKLVNHKFLKYY